MVVEADVGSVRSSPQSRNATMSGTISHVASSSACGACSSSHAQRFSVLIGYGW